MTHHLLLNKSGLVSNVHQFMYIVEDVQIQHGIGDLHIDLTEAQYLRKIIPLLLDTF